MSLQLLLGEREGGRQQALNNQSAEPISLMSPEKHKDGMQQQKSGHPARRSPAFFFFVFNFIHFKKKNSYDNKAIEILS